jgi:hypothetical protein
MAYGKIIPFVAAATTDATQAAVERVNADATPHRVHLEHLLAEVQAEIRRIDGVIMEMDAQLQRLHAQANQRAEDRLRRQVKIDQIREQRQLQNKADTSDIQARPER